MIIWWLIPVIFVALTYLLWQFHVIMPVYWASTRIKGLKEYYVSMWAGEDTAKYTKESDKGSLFWGYNCRARSEFIIFNGARGRVSWQFQNWRPRIAFWGGRFQKIQDKHYNRIGLIQKSAHKWCIPAGPNSWYTDADLAAYNHNVYLSYGVSIAIGSMHFRHLIQALSYAHSKTAVKAENV